MKYKFWVTSSRMTDIKQIIELPDDYDTEDIKSYLENWCENVFPMFHYTDAWVRYGYNEIRLCPECKKEYELTGEKEVWTGMCPSCKIRNAYYSTARDF